jgi:hypothetical protein
MCLSRRMRLRNYRNEACRADQSSSFSFHSTLKMTSSATASLDGIALTFRAECARRRFAEQLQEQIGRTIEADCLPRAEYQVPGDFLAPAPAKIGKGVMGRSRPMDHSFSSIPMASSLFYQVGAKTFCVR